MNYKDIYPRISSDKPFTLYLLPKTLEQKEENINYFSAYRESIQYKGHHPHQKFYIYDLYGVGYEYIRIETQYSCWVWDEDGNQIYLKLEDDSFVWMRVDLNNVSCSINIIDTGHELIDLEIKYKSLC